ncbi:hypothetical protein [Vibrio parahaemolyticus]|uniref:defense against restriction DarA-related protein n=1 Tax=Vibrio parahaemolyticus TaxID=670 RepID=UPI003D81C415
MRNTSRFAKDQSHNYVVVDFDNVTEKGLKKLITALKNAGSNVIDIEAPNKKMRRDGEVVKKAKLFFENGQAMTLFIGDEGDIYQMTLNNTKQPIPSVSNERELAKAMTQLMDRNQAKFEKAAARKAAKAVKDTSSTKPASRSISQRLNEAKTALSTAESNHANAQSARDTAQSQLDAESTKLSELEAELEREKQETKELEEQVEAAK